MSVLFNSYKEVNVGDTFVGKYSYPRGVPKEANLTNIQKLCPDNIDKVIFNYPATIVIFKDGTKEVVKCSEGDAYSPENGFAQAIMNVMFGSRSQFKGFIRKNEIACEINKVE